MRFGAAKRIAIMPQVPYFAAVPLADTIKTDYRVVTCDFDYVINLGKTVTTAIAGVMA
jgi:hypothetical protein